MLKVISKFDGKICLTFSELVLLKDKSLIFTILATYTVAGSGS